jgi:hypothetical protein
MSAELDNTKPSRDVEQCFSTFVRPQPGKFVFFIDVGPGLNKFTREHLSNFF